MFELKFPEKHNDQECEIKNICYNVNKLDEMIEIKTNVKMNNDFNMKILTPK